MTERLLDQIARFLDEEDFPNYTESKGQITVPMP